MSQSRAMRSAFGTVLRQPAIYFAEFVWRAILAITATMLTFYALIGYLDSMEVSDRDLLGLSGILPGTVAAALQHIFQGSGPMLVRMAIAVILGGGMLWLVLATAGQSVTLPALFGNDRPALREVVRRNVAKLALFFLSVAALFGAALVASNRSQIPPGGLDRAKFFMIILPLWLLVFTIGSLVGTYLSISSLRRLGPRPWRVGTGQFVWVAFVVAAMRLTLWLIAFFAFFVVLSMAMQSPAVAAWIAIMIYALAYTAASTFVHLLKLAGYARVIVWEAERPEALAAVV